MQLSPKPKMLSQFISPFLTYTSKFEHFEKQDDPHSLSISGAVDRKKRGYLNA